MISESRPGDVPTETPPCDFCGNQLAVLYCRADAAKLCLFCDQHVHSANLLSQKHHRSQICDNCSSEPASFLWSADNLALCTDCDRDAHSSSASHHRRTPLDGFSGCPSSSELASIYGLQENYKEIVEGFDLEDCWWHGVGGLELQDVVVPGGEGGSCDNIGRGSGRRKGELGRQLAEMIRNGRKNQEAEKESVGPGTPGRAVTWQCMIGWDVGEDVPEIQQGNFMSLLTTLRGNGVEGNGDVWNRNGNVDGTPNTAGSQNNAGTTQVFVNSTC